MFPHDFAADMDNLDSEKTPAQRIAEIPYWYHKIELPDGTVTPGFAPLDAKSYGVPPRLDGLRVLDVGAWDGYWTFEALKRGAREVVAIDDFSDHPEMEWKTFDLCRELLGIDPARCPRYGMSVYDVTPETFGHFDGVFLFGTLYHMRHPLLAMDRLAAVADTIYVESAILDDFSPYRGGLGQGYPSPEMVMEFYPEDEYGQNPTNWFVPTLRCLAGMLHAAGFTQDAKAWKLTNQPLHVAHCRGFAQGSRLKPSESR